MRGLYSSKTKIRHQIFTEVAKFAYEGGDYSKFEALPYKIIPGEISTYRESVFLERAIVGERLRLAMGLPLLPADEHLKTFKHCCIVCLWLTDNSFNNAKSEQILCSEL